MHNWLQNFTFKTTLNGLIFICCGLIVLAIALLTVSFQSWKAVIRNPVESLRYE
jgi:putative ABC transport system permease protein